MRHGKERGDYAAPLAFEGPLKGLKKERWPYSCVFEEMKVAKFCDRNKCADILALLLALKDKPAFTKQIGLSWLYKCMVGHSNIPRQYPE